MLNELLKHPDYKNAIENERNRYTAIVMDENTTAEDRVEALARFHMLNDLVSALHSAAFNT